MAKQTKFRCKGKDESGNPCPHKVVYERISIPGNDGGMGFIAPHNVRVYTDSKKARNKNVYLTCKDGHTHPYIVSE